MRERLEKVGLKEVWEQILFSIGVLRNTKKKKKKKSLEYRFVFQTFLIL